MSHPCGCAHDPAGEARSRRVTGHIKHVLRGDANQRTAHPADVFLLRTPAKGDAYEFVVTVHITWCIEGTESVKRLKARTPELNANLEDRLLHVIRPISRKHPPYEPQKAEEELAPRINAELAAATYRFDRGSAQARHGRVLVNPAKEVRETQRTAWKRHQELANAHELARLLREQLGERRGWWDQFLSEGLDRWLTPYAVELAENPEIASDVVKRIRDDQRERVTELADTFEGQVRRYKRSDDFDTMLSSETILRHLIKAVGLPVPPPGHPFGEPPDATAIKGNGAHGPGPNSS